MKSDNEKYQTNGAEGVFSWILLGLLIFRLFFLEDGEGDTSIVIVNFVGMMIALYSLVRNVFSRTNEKVLRAIGTVSCIIIFLSAIVISMTLFYGRLSFNEKWNDCITIAALLFSLSTNSICELLYGND